MLDRLDIHVEVPPVKYEELQDSAKEETSKDIKARVDKARQIQNERYKGENITCLFEEGHIHTEECYSNGVLTCEKLENHIHKDSCFESILNCAETENGHIKIDRRGKTNLAGCFAAGDVTGRPYQYAKAVGEGNVAAHSVVEYLAKG